jgi:CO/xanthine dehydrogenase FAD-binding subunit
LAPDLCIIVARSLTKAITHLSAGGARVAAGGTELAGTLHIDGPRTTKVVDISQLDELKGFDRTSGGGLRIGALATLAGVAAAALVIENSVADISVVLGAAAPVPWRAREAEALLVGREPAPQAVQAAADAALADALPLADNRYKLVLFRNLLVESPEEVCGLRPSA